MMMTMIMITTMLIMNTKVMIMNTTVIMRMVMTVKRACLFVICNHRCLFIWILKAAAIVTRQGVVRQRVSIFKYKD